MIEDQRQLFLLSIIFRLGSNALHNAAFYGSAEVLELLLSHPKLDTSLQTNTGETALQLGADRPRILELLLSNHKWGINNIDIQAAFRVRLRKRQSLYGPTLKAMVPYMIGMVPLGMG